LSEEVNEGRIDEAQRLFVNNTMSVIKSGKELGVDMPQDMMN
jgi:hypothetical protein